jgi:hypothetical protein
MSVLGLIPVLGRALELILPDPQAQAEAKLKMYELVQKGELSVLESETKIALAQADINKADASSGSMYRGGWRPGAGWVCVGALAFEFILRPFTPLIAALFGVEAPTLPSLEMDTLMGLLMALLGLGGFRTFERIRGKA